MSNYSHQMEQLWNDFLERWPRESLPKLTLEAYTAAGSNDSFCYWLEKRTEQLGSIWGGSAFKFGVYSRLDITDKPDKNGRRYTSSYGWLTKYGDSPQAAFERVKAEIIKVAEASYLGKVDTVHAADLGEVVRWKIAFLYQNRSNTPCILPIFKSAMLRAVLDERKIDTREAHRKLLSARGETSLFDYAAETWNKASEIVAGQLSVDDAIEYLNSVEGYEAIKPPTRKMAGYRNSEGKQLAVVLEGKQVSLFMSPGRWLASVRNLVKDVTEYAADKSRNSNLAANAPELAEGNPALMVVVGSLKALQAVVEAYEEEEVMARADDEMVVAKGADSEQKSAFPLNQILYGPPGTGKTYYTTELAVRIADPEWYQAAELRYAQTTTLREVVKARYLELFASRRIMFTTFHQSFSYEDFVEGIRASSEEGVLKYEVEDGVFKQMCDQARVEVQAGSQAPISLVGRRVWKMSLGNTQSDEGHLYDECIENGYVLLGYGGNIDFTQCIRREDIHELLEQQGSSLNKSDYSVSAVHTFRNKMNPGDLVIVSDGNQRFRAIAEITGDYAFLGNDEREDYQQLRRVEWLRIYAPSLPVGQLFKKSLTQRTLYELKATTLDRARLEALLSPSTEVARHLPHVLIIDEINRGNISRIFGELITLLEPSKRAGANDEQSVVLPYSKQEFSVPDNLYVIGTMNTADRSLARLDLALRRRFSFIERLPQAEVLGETRVHGVQLSTLLRWMNLRIEALLDAEHVIGHTYFLPVTRLETEQARALKLGEIFRDKIIPLLREYFFEDYERIAWVLNDPVKPTAARFIQSSREADLPGLEALFPGADIAAQVMDRRYRVNLLAFDTPVAYQGILGKMDIKSAKPVGEHTPGNVVVTAEHFEYSAEAKE